MSVTILEERPLGGQTLRGTVLFADLRGYTALAERLSPSAVVAVLEEFFSILIGIVSEHDGTVYHLAGDCLMAGFGLADATGAPIRAAMAASRRMITALEAPSNRWEDRFGVVTGTGIGLNVGDLACAELGPPTLRRRTLIGDTVNVAARLCQRARAGEVLFSARVAEALDAQARASAVALPEFALRGRDAPVGIYCIPARERLMLERPVGKDRTLKPPYAVA